MKKILISFVLLIISLSGFSQVFLIDSKSITVPRHADFAAISAAIPTPTNGQLVYNNQFNVFLYYNGTSWVSFPSSSGTQPWIISGNNIKYNTGNVGIGIGSATSTATLDILRASGTPTTPHLAMGISGQASQIVTRYYNGASGTGGIFETVVPNTTLANALVKWEHSSGGTPTAMMTLSGPGNFSINGSSTIVGNEIIGGNSTVSGNNITSGFTQLGSTASPIKTSLIIFSTASSALNTSIPHGLTASKIVSYQVIINGSGTSYVTNNNLGTGLEFWSSFDTNFINITRSSTNGSTLAGKSGKIFITYTN